MQVGECNERIPQFYYNTQTGICEAFEYSGCGGNTNRFESKEQCDRQCGEFRGIGKFFNYN